jgi:hypothetical protein
MLSKCEFVEAERRTDQTRPWGERKRKVVMKGYKVSVRQKE